MLAGVRSVPNWAWAVIFLALLVGRALSFRYKKGLNKYRGPFLASFTNFWRLWQAWIYHDRVTYPDLLQYGKVIRLGPNTLLFSEPDAVKDIYTTGFSKSNQYRVAAGVSRGQVVKNLFSTTDKEWHGRLRRSVSNAFALSTLIQYEPLVTRTMTTFMQVVSDRFADKPDPDGIVDLSGYVKYIALDLISELTFGTTYGLLEAGRDHIGIIKGRTDGIRYFHVCYNMSWIDDVLYKNPILLWLGRRGWYGTVTPTVPFALNQISARHATNAKNAKGKEDKGSVDLLTRFLDAKSEYPEVVDDTAVLGLTLSMVNAGSATIATTLAACFHFLLRSPDKMRRLVSELDESFPPPKEHVTSFEEWVVPFGPAQKLPYLDACIKETFRIWPALGAQLLERVTPPEGAVIAGEEIPGGIIVTSNAWIVQRHKPTYGEDVEVYRPERWLESSKEQVAAMNRHLLVWGSGPNTCIGKSIAYLELWKIIPTTLRMFTIEEVDPNAPLKIFNIGDPELLDFYVRFKSRFTRK